MAERISEAEFERIYDETVAELYGYASRRCGGQRELAEDVTQEAWLRALRDWSEHGVPDNPIGWLTTVARNLLFNYFRRREGVSLDLISPAAVLDAVEANTVSDSAEVASAIESFFGPAMDLSPTASRFDNSLSWVAAIGNEAALGVFEQFGAEAVYARNADLTVRLDVQGRASVGAQISMRVTVKNAGGRRANQVVLLLARREIAG